jgi:MFS family permease
MVWEVTEDALHLGYLGLAQGIPLVVFQLWGGVLADRVNRLRLLLVTQSLTTTALLAAFLLSASGVRRVELLLALAALSNTFRAFDEPSRMALVPQMVGRERLPNAIALGSIPWQAGRMIGPSITGVLIAAFGGTVGFGLAVGASAFALAMYARLRVEGHAPAPADGHALSQLMAGLRFVRGDFVFAALICLALFNAVFGLSYVTLLPIFADVYFRAGSAGYGLLNAGHGLGALAGTLLVAAVAPRLARRGHIIHAGAAGMGLGLVVFSRAPGLAVAVPVLACVGFSNTFYLTQVSTQLQQTVPDRLRGRVMSLYSLCWNLLPLGGLLGGVLAAAVDARFAVAVGGAMVAVNAIVLLASRRLRRL